MTSQVGKGLLDNGEHGGTVHVTIVHGTRSYEIAENVNGRIKERPAHSWTVVHKCELPLEGNFKNPAYCPAAANYVRNTWAAKSGLWSLAIVELLQHRVGVCLDNSNQALEGRIRTKKHDTDIHSHLADLGKYMVHWDKEAAAADSAMFTDLESANIRIKAMLKSRQTAMLKASQKRLNEAADFDSVKVSIGKQPHFPLNRLRG